MKASILIVYTGGTIGMIQDEESGLLVPFKFENILNQIPQLKKIEANISAVSVENPKDSANMHLQDWQEIGQILVENYEKYSGFVVLHGTDTMAYTTSALSFMLSSLGKPIVFTGSQLPIGHIRTDATENVLTAIEITLLKKNNAPLIREVCLYFGGKLYRGNCVTKISSNDFNAFVSPHVEPLIISNLKLKINHKLLKKEDVNICRYLPKMDPSVFVYKIHPGITSFQFNQLFKSLEIKVLICETYGSGTIFNDEWLVQGLQQLIRKGVQIINVSQCVFGKVSSIYEVSNMLHKIGVINAKTMTLEACICKAMHLLANGVENEEFKSVFSENIAGELS